MTYPGFRVINTIRQREPAKSRRKQRKEWQDMMKFEKNIEERKVLVKRLGELTGIAPYYTKVPRCAYEIGAYTVEQPYGGRGCGRPWNPYNPEK